MATSTSDAREPPPVWFKDSIAYQIWPSSYSSSYDASIHRRSGLVPGLGNIPSIISTRDYLQDLGVGVIWLSPHYASPQKDLGYDILDYEAVHPPFGTMSDMDQLISEVHKRDMRIIVDLVINHTSDQHAWFQESKKSRDNPKADFYIWRDHTISESGEKKPPNNWRAWWGGSAWEYCEERGQYYLHLFTKEQPDFNFENEAARHAMYETAIEYWLKKGVDGFRVDVVNLYSKDPAFPDTETLDPNSELQMPWRVLNGPRMHEFLKEIRRKVLDKYGPDIMMVGECSQTPREEVQRYVRASSRELDMVFDFSVLMVGRELTDSGSVKISPFHLPDLKSAVEVTQHMMRDTDNDAWCTVFLENHDSTRSLSRYGTEDPRYMTRSGKLLAIFQATLSGTLFLYQGQEIGMTNLLPLDSSADGTYTLDDIKDVASLQFYQLLLAQHSGDASLALKEMLTHTRDNCRVPVRWTPDAPNYGFCPADVKPWIKIPPHTANKTDVFSSQKDPDSILATWKAVLKLRQTKEWRNLLIYGGFEVVDKENTKVFAYWKTPFGSQQIKRRGGRRVCVLLNFSSEQAEVPAAIFAGCDSNAKDDSAADGEAEAEKKRRNEKWSVLMSNIGYQSDGGAVTTDQEKEKGKMLQPWEARVYVVE